MKILVVHNRYRPVAPSGENKVVDQESAGLAALGHEVRLFQRFSGDIESWPLAKRATLPLRVLWSRESQRDLAAELAAFAPDVVHVHNTFPLLTPSILYTCRDAGVPVVATIHNYKLACATGEFFRDGKVCHDCLGNSGAAALQHGCYRGSRLATTPIVAAKLVHSRAWQQLISGYIFISGSQRDLLAPLGLPAQRCFVKYNGVPEPDAAAASQTRGHQVAYVGRLDAAKGVPFLMRAWDTFRSRRPDSPLRLVMAGGGPLSDEVTAWASRSPSVTFLGHLRPEEVSGVLGSARATILPSTWEETFGLVAVESMALGTPPIGSGHGSFPELITDGKDGALFAPGDPGALADVLAEVDDTPARWEDYGRQARETYLSTFTPEVSLARLLEIYRYAAADPAPAVRAVRAPGLAHR